MNCSTLMDMIRTIVAEGGSPKDLISEIKSMALQDGSTTRPGQGRSLDGSITDTADNDSTSPDQPAELYLSCTEFWSTSIGHYSVVYRSSRSTSSNELYYMSPQLTQEMKRYRDIMFQIKDVFLQGDSHIPDCTLPVKRKTKRAAHQKCDLCPRSSASIETPIWLDEEAFMTWSLDDWVVIESQLKNVIE